tara:strand:+ start:9547 stop:10887 length:1341 start_codon:yes stop_codon:yes gene_type:complete
MKEKFFYIKTYGCQMNFYDSEKISDLLKPLGFKPSENLDICELAILNTCHIREKASEKMYSDIGRLAKYKNLKLKNGKNFKIAICGCVAQAEGKRILEKNKNVDMVFGPQNYHTLPQKLKEISSINKILDINFPKESKFDFFPKPSNKGTTAFVSIQEGCDKFCTFCVVPYTRGAEFSRPVNDIIFEIKSLARLGVKEVTLLGQNVNAYKGSFRLKDGSRKFMDLANLFSEINQISEIKRIRYITSHPADMSDDLIIAHSKIKKLMPYLHLPIQSGSNKILRKMNRKYTKENYVKIVGKLRESRKDLALTSDFIVGFPGETSQDFDETMDIVKEVKFAGAYSFKYSPRPGTPAFELKNLVDETESNRRLQTLQKELLIQQNNFNKSFIGKNLSVLIEKEGKKKNQYVGRSQYLQPVHVFSNENIIGKIFNVSINEITSHSLHGEIN